MSMIEKLKKLDAEISEKLKIKDTSSPLFRAAALFARSGDSWLWCGILFVLWLIHSGETERTLAFWGGSIALTAVFVLFLKRLIARSRPEGEWGKIYRKGDPYSFPSGHAVRAGLILVLAVNTFRNPVVILLFILWAILMILSRVATGVHYLLDILAGFLLGLFIGGIFIQLQPWIYKTFPILFNKSSWFGGK